MFAVKRGRRSNSTGRHLSKVKARGARHAVIRLARAVGVLAERAAARVAHVALVLRAAHRAPWVRAGNQVSPPDPAGLFSEGVEAM